MKKFLKFLENALMVFIYMYELAEFLAVPALLVIIGIFCSLPWQYYVISLAIYVLLYILLEIISSLIAKALSKKYSPLIAKKLDKILSKFDKD